MIKKNELAKKREQELVDDLAILEGYIQAFWEVLPTPVCVTNSAFVILEAGNAFFRLFGLDESESIGLSLEAVFKNPEDFLIIQKELEAEDKVFNKEAFLKTKSSQEIIGFVSAVPRKDSEASAGPAGYLFSFVDITSLKKTQKKLKEKIAALEKFEKLAVGRELRMIELKKKLKIALEEKNGK